MKPAILAALVLLTLSCTSKHASSGACCPGGAAGTGGTAGAAGTGGDVGTGDCAGTEGTKPSTYTVNVTIQDDGGAPGADFGPWSITQNDGCTFSASGDSDTNHSPVVPASGDFYTGRTYTIRFGPQRGYSTPSSQQIAGATTVVANYVPTVGINHDIFYIGHSLFGGWGTGELDLKNTIPIMVEAIVKDLGHTITWDFQSIAGASLEYQWNNTGQTPQPPGLYPNVPARTAIASGTYDTIVVTEQQPVSVWWFPQNSTRNYMVNFFDLIDFNAQPDTKFFLYETWNCRAAGTPQGCDGVQTSGLNWYQLLTAEATEWQDEVDGANALRPARPQDMLYMPIGSKYLKALVDAVDGPGVTGIPDSDALFEDIQVNPEAIHISEYASYMIALAMVAIVYDVDIRTATDVIRNPVTSANYDLNATTCAEIRDIVYGVWAEVANAKPVSR